MADPAEVIAKLHILYQRGLEEPTERDVSVTDFDPSTISGHCHLRGQYRTFRIFDISQCHDTATGEIVETENIPKLLFDHYKKTPRYTLDVLHSNHLEALQILLYVGKSDGQLRAAERKVIAAACKVLTGDGRITEEMVSELIDSINIPTIHSFKVAVGRVAKRGNPAMMKRLMIACNTIINTQKNITATEQEALDYMAKRFAK
ncbi:hypothetical protein [Pseudomonas sp.]|uniref:hypothetical protein n=1 Tax=Pseudomonas sp. TaxID=306 RepID=UPI003981B74E